MRKKSLKGSYMIDRIQQWENQLLIKLNHLLDKQIPLKLKI